MWVFKLGWSQIEAVKQARGKTVVRFLIMGELCTMAIKFACSKCQKTYRVKDELAGKTAKCAKCNHRFKIPAPASLSTKLESAAPLAAVAESESDLASWMEAELATAPSPAPEAKQDAAKQHCSACGSPLASGAALCIACGFDVRSSKKQKTKKVVKRSERPRWKAAGQSATLARGALFSAIGAALGAALWFAVVLFTGYEIGWIAWGLGFSAGAGMAIGHDDPDGTMAGILAGAISIVGILGAKFLIFEHLKSQVAEVGISPDVLSEIVGEPFTFGSLFGPIDELFILLAVGSAYKIGSGQVTD